MRWRRARHSNGDGGGFAAARAKAKEWNATLGDSWVCSGASFGVRQPDVASAVKLAVTRGATRPSSSETGRCTVASIQLTPPTSNSEFSSVINS